MEKPVIISCPGKVPLSIYLRQHGAAPPTPCGGRGNCGKCIVRVLEGRIRVSAMDRVHLSEEQIAQGYRLACQAMPEETCVLEVFPYRAAENI